MTSVDSVECDAVSLLPLETTDVEVEGASEKENHISLSQCWGSGVFGVSRMREEEGMVRVLSANLRELDSEVKLSRAMERIDGLVENYERSWNRDEAYLLCAQKLAPTHAELALKYAEKLEFMSDQIEAYLEIAKYQEGASLSASLQKVSEHFYSFTADSFLPFYDELLAKGGEEVMTFFNTIYAKIQPNYRWYSPSFLDLLAQAELQIKLKLPGVDETLRKAYEALNLQDWIDEEHVLRFLECEIQVASPLLPETFKRAQQCQYPNTSSWPNFDTLLFKIMLLDFETKHPEFAQAFEKDLEEALLFAEDDYDLFLIVKVIATHQRSAAEKVVERIEGEVGQAFTSFILTLSDAQHPHFNDEVALQELKETVERVQPIDPDDLIGMFLISAKVFGPEKVHFLLDEAFKQLQPTVDEIYSEELKKAGKTFAHYLGEAFGLNFSKPQEEKENAGCELSKFSNLSISNASDLMEAYSYHDLPETREILQVLYDKLKRGEDPYELDTVNMVRAEFTLLGL